MRVGDADADIDNEVRVEVADGVTSERRRTGKSGLNSGVSYDCVASALGSGRFGRFMTRELVPVDGGMSACVVCADSKAEGDGNHKEVIFDKRRQPTQTDVRKRNIKNKKKYPHKNRRVIDGTEENRNIIRSQELNCGEAILV